MISGEFALFGLNRVRKKLGCDRKSVNHVSGTDRNNLVGPPGHELGTKGFGFV
jgi:hypothetical protein